MVHFYIMYLINHSLSNTVVIKKQEVLEGINRLLCFQMTNTAWKEIRRIHRQTARLSRKPQELTGNRLDGQTQTQQNDHIRPPHTLSFIWLNMRIIICLFVD
jgi:hypothetical protein